MRVFIDKAVYDQPNAAQYLDNLIQMFDISRHDWIIKDDNDFDHIVDSQWATTARLDIKNSIMLFVEENYMRNFYNTQQEDITISPTKLSYSYNELPLIEGINYLQEKIWVVVENQFNDKYFLDALFLHFADTKTQKAKNEKWLEYRQVGGTGDIPKFIDEVRAKYNAKPRVIIIIDSDKLNGTAALGKIQQNIESKCIRHNILYHILYKREMENYLPDAVLATVPVGQQPAYLSFIALTNIQKDYCDLEKHFTGMRPKQNLPPLFANATKADLLARCAHQPNPNELQDIIDKITQLL